MLPFGNHKRGAISTMIELLAGALNGDSTSDKALEWRGTTTIAPCFGALILVFDPRVTAEAFIGAIEGQGARQGAVGLAEAKQGAKDRADRKAPSPLATQSGSMATHFG